MFLPLYKHKLLFIFLAFSTVLVIIISMKNKIKNIYKKKIIVLLIITLLVLSLSGCAKNQEPITKTGLYFNTVVTLTIYNQAKSDVLEDCFSLCTKYENMFSKTVSGSDVYNINHANGRPTTVSDETIYLLQTILYYSDLTDGVIDATIAPLSELWNFTGDNPSAPADSEIKKLLPHVNYRNIVISGNTVTLLDSEATVDLGCIAKGYIADQLKKFLLSHNVDSALINLGGNILAVGDKPDGTPFRVGIQKPFADQNEPITTLTVNDLSVVSSGVYERYFYENNICYHHLLDTKTGYPKETDLLGVTILSKSSTTGDALSTTCFLLGLEDGMELIEQLDEIEAIFITADYQLHYSSGLQ